MHAWKRTRNFLAIAMAIALIEACSGIGPQQSRLAITPPPPSLPLEMQRNAQGGTQQQPSSNADVVRAIYIADAINNDVTVFDVHGNLTATITDGVSGPWGLLVDGNQNLWVANSGFVSMYPKGQTKPTRTLQDPNQSPEDVSVARDGTVYVSNFFTGTVSVYAPGSNTPTTMLSDSTSQYTVGVASDSSGDVFVTVNDATGVGYLDKFVGGKQSGFKRLAPRFSFASDIKIDNAGNLLILDETQLSVTEFTPAGRPTGLRIGTFYQWNSFDVSRGGSYIVGTEALPDQDRGVLKRFPANKRLLYFKDNFGGGIAGVAIAPGRFF